ncbi:prolyl 4-hydroxylase subunit alpha-2-like [Planococcus citri]|uniref:prolyl 4-hydroxylase subunit alpha-2-like n=1 Tax=Planococcus citri TaxID=170843 RepID=UPI0031F9FEF1
MYNSHLFLNDTEQAYTFAELYSNADSFDIPSNDVTISLGEQLGKVIDLHHIILESNKLCRGDYKQFLPAQNLRCRYNHENSAFLKIAPVKEEELYDHPKILLYHNVVYESEINTIKSVSADELKTSTGYMSGNKTPVTAFLYRMSQTAFVNNELPELSFFSRRIEDISDLALKHCETLQVVNYAPGGFYRVHTDYLPPHEDYLGKSGNRIATVLFYLNDVPLGGETVFPRLKLSVSPEKGSALIWHNMLPDGSVNLLTHHSACPVIIGEKWIITQWIRAKGQKCLRRVYASWKHDTSSDGSTEDQ